MLYIVSYLWNFRYHLLPFTTFRNWAWICVARCREFGTLLKANKTPGFCNGFKALAGVGCFQRACITACRMASAEPETCSSELLRGQGADSPRWIAIWSIASSGLLRWYCTTGAALEMTWPHFFTGRRNTLHRWNGQIAKRIGTRPLALQSTFHVWRHSRRVAPFLNVAHVKTCRRLADLLFVFHVSNFEDWRHLRLRFQSCG